FTPEGGRVEVKLGIWEQGLEASKQQTPKPYAQITVTDTGEGISPDFLPHVFDRFRQADSSITRSYGGLGLGMAIVRHIAERHGGTVIADSEGIGRGATFTVLLPLAVAGEIANGHSPAAMSDTVPQAGDRPVQIDHSATSEPMAAVRSTSENLI
ncbi:MAG: diguanylate cyclase, partial [Microcoleus sp. SIO2G3]|nr:diguanylate cyclase [Microcoleus sp. SIO2G3]